MMAADETYEDDEATAVDAEENVREVHPESPELVAQEALDELEGVEEPKEAAPETEELAPQQADPPQHQPQMVPLQAMLRERQQRQELAAQINVMAEQNKEFTDWLASKKRSEEEAAAAAAVPSWEDDPRGNLAHTITAPLMPAIQKLQEKVDRLDGFVNQAEVAGQAQQAEMGWRQAFTSQEQHATPQETAAINMFHTARFREFQNQGYDEQTAGHLANEARFKLYMSTQQGPAGLAAAYQSLGVDPSQVLGSMPESPAAAEVPAEVPVGPYPAVVPQERDDPPPIRHRRPDHEEASALNFVLHNFNEIETADMQKHVTKIAEERQIGNAAAWKLVADSMAQRRTA